MNELPMNPRQGALAGQVVLVTGAGRGIGAAIARGCAREGALVVVNYLHNAQTAQAVADECRLLGGEGWALPCDVADASAVQSMMTQIERETGRLDVVVNNALRPYRFDPEARDRFWTLEWSHYQTQFEGAVQACFQVCQAALPLMRKRACGSIVNITSDLVDRPSVPYHDYTTAKSALVGFSRNLAAELGPLGIRVNCVAPGLVFPTEGARATREEVRELIASQTPLRRVATPDDVVGPVLFLASDWGRFVTGQVVTVDGGWVMR
jgi:3-oxoacyl-[acyl-carrier protein] reductase